MAENTETSEEKVQVDEWAAIRRWRRMQLQKAGFSDDLAQVIAACNDIDYYKAIRLVENGCKPSIAALILL